MNEIKRIAIGADHRGYAIKQYMMQTLVQYEWHDVGAHSQERSDYPVFGHEVAQMVAQHKVAHGVLLCGSGIGMSIVANRYSGLYAALCWNEEVARASRQDDNSNILVLPADFITNEQAVAIFTAWMATPFKYERYQERLAMIDKE